jgi:3-isopropylmalate/(R)-2-methylmalate dehydratase small subunit
MKAYTVCEAIAAPLLMDNIDTDMIVRIERIAQLVRGQFAPYAFEMMRYDADGKENAGFILNRPPFRQAQILLAGANFGCGSSREMAVWALDEFGIRCVIAQSFGDIFYNNCLQNGLLPVRLAGEQIARLATVASTGQAIAVDLRDCRIRAAGLEQMAFDFPAERRLAFLEGLDEIAQTMKLQEQIRAFQQRDQREHPWAYNL